MRRWRRLSIVGLGLGLGLIACGVAATPTPSHDALVSFGCFRPMTIAPGEPSSAIPLSSAEQRAREYFAMNGAILVREADADGILQFAPPIEARTVTVRSSDYGATGDLLRGRELWLLTFAVEGHQPWSALPPGRTISLVVDATTNIPLLGCSGR